MYVCNSPTELDVCVYIIYSLEMEHAQPHPPKHTHILRCGHGTSLVTQPGVSPLREVTAHVSLRDECRFTDEVLLPWALVCFAPAWQFDFAPRTVGKVGKYSK